MPQCRVRVCLLHLIIVTSQLCNWYIISQRMFEVSSRFWFISQTLPGYLTATPHVILDGLGLLGTHCLSSPSLIEPSCCRAWTDGQDEDGSSWGKSLFSALCCRVPICLVRRKGSAGLLRKKKKERRQFESGSTCSCPHFKNWPATIHSEFGRSSAGDSTISV